MAFHEFSTPRREGAEARRLPPSPCCGEEARVGGATTRTVPLHSRIAAFVRLASVVVLTFLAALAAGLSALAVIALNFATWLLSVALAFRATPGLPVRAPPLGRAPLLSEDDMEIGLVSDGQATVASEQPERAWRAAVPADVGGSVAEGGPVLVGEQPAAAAVLDAVASTTQSCPDIGAQGAATPPTAEAQYPDRDSDDPSARSSRLRSALQHLGLSEQQVLMEDFDAMSRQELTLEKQRVRRELDCYEQELATRLSRAPRPEEKEEMRPLYIYYWRAKEALASAVAESDDDASSLAAMSTSSMDIRVLQPCLPRTQAPTRLADDGRKTQQSRISSRAGDSEHKLPETSAEGQGQTQAQQAAAFAQRVSQVPRPQPRTRKWR